MTFYEIVEEFKHVVFNLALRYTQNYEDAEEITQDVFLSVHQKVQLFRHDAKLKTWIYQITIHKSIDAIKAKNRLKRRGTLIRLEDLPAHHYQPANLIHPGLLTEQKEALNQLLQSINQLPENQKTVIILLKIQQLSQHECALIMNLSEKAVESLFQRAKKNLLKILASREGL